MLQLEYFVVAESVTIDQLTNQVSVFNIIDELRVKLPLTLGRIVAVASWNAEEADKGNDYQVAVRVTGIGAQPKEPLRLNVSIEGRRCRTIMHMQGIQVDKPSRIVLDLSINDEHKATHTIDVSGLDDPDH